MTNVTADDIWSIIRAGRGERADWMGENAPIDSLAAAMAAMANTSGGVLLLGVVGPTASVLGVREGEIAVDRILQAALAIEPPLIIPLPRTVRVNEKLVVVASIPRGMPHVYAIDGRFLAREGTENTALKPRDLRRLMIERGEVSFESGLPHGATLDDLDWERVRAYVASLGNIGEPSVERVLIKRGCAAVHEGRVRPTNAGLLLFGKEPQRFIRGADLVAARFAGETMGDMFTREDIAGTLPDQIRRAETFLFDHLRKNQQLGRAMARDEQFEYPLEAARELVVNAVAHRDYAIDGDGIRLFLFQDHMEVTSPGGLPGHVTVSNIKDERYSRNPIIVQVLSDMGFIERLGYGVDRVLDLMEAQRFPKPLFEETDGGFRVTLYAQEAADDDFSPPSLLTTAALDLPPSPFNGEYHGIPLNPRQEIALVYLHSRGTRITNSDLQALCPDVHAETIRRDLADLVTKNLLRKLGEKRGSYYVLVRDEHT